MRIRAIAMILAAWPAGAHAADPDLPGSLPTLRETYGVGDTAFMPENFGFAPVELRGVIHRPADLDAGPFPLVVMLHGRHASCFDPQIPTDDDPYANASVDDATADAGANARAQLIGAHLEPWTAFNDTDEYGTSYNDSVDLQNIGPVGSPEQLVETPVRGIGHIEVPNYYNSSLVLQHDAWKSTSEALGGHLLVAIPVPDLLLYADGRDPETLAQLRATVTKITSEAPNAVFDGVLRWTPKGWDVVAPR